MSRIRGQEVTIRISVDGKPQEGTWARVKDFSVSERTELVEENYVGDQYTSLDRMRNGYDLSFTVDMQDRSVIDFIDSDINNEENQDALPAVTISVLYSFRDGTSPVGEVYYDAVLKIAEQSMTREEYVSYSIEAKAQRKKVLEIA